MSIRMIRILDPRVEVKTVAEAAVPALPDLAGKVIGFISNDWPSLSILWPRLSYRLCSEYKVSETFEAGVPTATAPPPGTLEAAAGRSDAAIVGLAN